MNSATDRLRGFALACHPGPTVAVTAGVTLLAAEAGRGAAGSALVLVTVLVGQLSIGWSNDAIDAGRDLAVGRAGKPVVDGLVSRRALAVAAVVALAVATALSFVAAGPAGGVCHVVLLASAWAYNLGLKTTRWSLVPYAVGFGALPGFVTYGLDPSLPPPTWATLAAALLGVAAGLANAAPDVVDDTATGVHGAVGRLGAVAARRWCAAVAMVATVAVAFGSDLAVAGSAALVAVVGLALGAGLVVRAGRLLFPVVLVVAVGLVVVVGPALAP